MSRVRLISRSPPARRRLARVKRNPLREFDYRYNVRKTNDDARHTMARHENQRQAVDAAGAKEADSLNVRWVLPINGT